MLTSMASKNENMTGCLKGRYGSINRRGPGRRE